MAVTWIDYRDPLTGTIWHIPADRPLDKITVGGTISAAGTLTYNWGSVPPPPPEQEVRGMLKQEDLTAALKQADREAGVCGKFCRSGATIDEGRYLLWHNGLGPSDSSEQVVHTSAVLNFSAEALKDHLNAWLTDLHARKPHDLNWTP